MPTIARNERLDAQLKELPDSPGVYLFHDRDGNRPIVPNPAPDRNHAGTWHCSPPSDAAPGPVE